MCGYKENFEVKGKLFSNNIFFAPLSGYTDVLFRKMCIDHLRPGLFFCEMVKMEALVRNIEKTYEYLKYEKEMHPIGAQIVGASPRLAGECTEILMDLGFDWIDLNCGCPVNKVVKDGSGSAMLKKPDLIGRVLEEIVKKSNGKAVVSVKIRSGWDQNSINAVEVLKIAENAGVDVIFVHGRTRAQGYSGKSDQEVIKKCKEVATSIKVIGNGDLFSPQDVQKMFDYTKCDGVLLARGMIGKPWMVQKIKEHYSSIESSVNSMSYLKDRILEHFNMILGLYEPKRAILEMRKMAPWYLKGCENTKRLKIKINQTEDPFEIIKMVEAL